MEWKKKPCGWYGGYENSCLEWTVTRCSWGQPKTHHKKTGPWRLCRFTDEEIEVGVYPTLKEAKAEADRIWAEGWR